MNDRAVIIGGGQAGARAAKAMREAGYAGAITILAAELHLPYERPLLSKARLLDATTPLPLVFDGEALSAMDIIVQTGTTVSSIERAGRQVVLGDGSRLRYDRLLLATGSRVRQLEIPGVAPEQILGLRTIDDAMVLERRLRAGTRMAVIGGGFIGLEVAASAAARGCVVTVIEAADRLLPRLGCPEASALVLAHHQAIGIDFRMARTVVRGDGDRLLLDDGAEVGTDVIVIGIGVAPETALAERAGLEVRDGIVVDQDGRTSDPLVFAAGDCTRFYHPLLARHVRLESWQSANLQADAAGRAMADRPDARHEVPWLWSDQGDLNLQMAGSPDHVDRTVVRGGPTGEDGLTILQLAGKSLVGGITVNRGKDMTLIRRALANPGNLLDPECLADSDIPLRKALAARELA